MKQATKIAQEGRERNALGLEHLLQLLDGLLLLVRRLGARRNDDILDVDVVGRVARGHDVLVVDELEERLDLGALQDLLLRHRLGDRQRRLLETGDERVTELALLGAVVVRLDDDRLLACEATGDNDNHLAWLDAARAKETA